MRSTRFSVGYLPGLCCIRSLEETRTYPAPTYDPLEEGQGGFVLTNTTITAQKLPVGVSIRNGKLLQQVGKATHAAVDEKISAFRARVNSDKTVENPIENPAIIHNLVLGAEMSLSMIIGIKSKPTARVVTKRREMPAIQLGDAMATLSSIVFPDSR